MNLATRCPRCATTFRVQEVQLTASDGHVRCGRCDTVFDARLSLFDLDSGEPLGAAAQQPEPYVDAETLAPALETPQAPEAERDWSRGEVDARTTVVAGDPPSAPVAEDDLRQEPAWRDGPWPAPQAVPTPSENLSAHDMNERLHTLLKGGTSEQDAEVAASAGNLGAWQSLRDTEANAAETQGWRRKGPWLLVAALLLALPVQWAWTERAALRAKSAGFDALMTRLCAGCANAPWQHLEGLSVEASSLQPTPQGGAYQLSLTVKNRAGHTLAMPWVELRLSDANGRPVLRKTISPQELGAKVDRVAGSGALSLAGTFRLPEGARISGYEISLFHP